MPARKKSRTPAARKGNRKPAQRRAAASRVAGQTTTKVSGQRAKQKAKKPASKVNQKKASKLVGKTLSKTVGKKVRKKVRKTVRKTARKKAASAATTKGRSSKKSLLKMVEQRVQKIVKTVLASGTNKPANTAPKLSTASTKVKGVSPRPSAPKAAALEDATVPPAEHHTPPAAVAAQADKPWGSAATRAPSDRPRTATPVPQRTVVPPVAAESAAEPSQTPAVRTGAAGSAGGGGAGRTDRGSAAGDAQISARPEGPQATSETSGGDTEERPPLPVPIASFTI